MYIGSKAQASGQATARATAAKGPVTIPFITRRLAVAVAVFLVVGGAVAAVYIETARGPQTTAPPLLPPPAGQAQEPEQEQGQAQGRTQAQAQAQEPEPAPARTAPSAPPVAPSPGYTAPELPVRSRAEAAEKGVIVVLCFVSASSGPSIAQLPAMGRVAGDYPGVQVVLVAVGEKEATLSAWLESRAVHQRLAAHAVPDPGGAEARRWQVTAAPTTFIVRADGIVDWLRVGTVDYDELAAAIKRAGG